MSGALDLSRVSYAYEGGDVLRAVSLSVAAGEIVCLLGPSGCGKTTCLRIAAGLERLERGDVRVAGRRVAGSGVHVPPEERRVGLVLQDYALFPHMSVEANVAFGIAGLAKAERRRRVRALLAQVGLQAYAKSYPHQLSGGQQQRVALARALAPEPDVMLMDEPFSGLDVTMRAQVRDETVAVLRRRRAPTLIVTHDPDEALAVADRIAIMRAGAIVQIGTPEEVYLEPADPFVMTFFGAPNRLTGTVDESGGVETPFGRLTADGVAPGTPVEVFFRGGALRTDAEDGTDMRVEDTRLLGPIQRVSLRGPDGAGPIVLDQPRRQAVSPGERLSVAADFKEFHVFPSEQLKVESDSSF